MYLGIPYGKVDPNNPFGPSSPAPAFDDIFNATDDSAECPQEDNELFGTLDCLHLSVYIPQFRSTPLPVLVFIHGGAFEFGSYSRSSYGPKFLVRHDIILVTLNYRLGAFGYMCTDSPRVPGNQASKDQLLALKWINENIAYFGGDPNRVTLSGTSAGAMSTDLIIASDEGARYFQQAILQSGSAFLPDYSPPSTRNAPFILAEYFGFSTNDIDEALDYLAAIDPLQIISVSRRLNLPFRACVERKFEGVEAFMTENWVAKEVIEAKDLKIIIGFNKNEALGLFVWPYSDLTNIIEESLGDVFPIDHEDFVGLSEVRRFFFGDEKVGDELLKEAVDLRSDHSFIYNSMRSVQRYQRSGVEEVFLYLFSYDGERNSMKPFINTTLPGAVHGDEIGYLYEGFDLVVPNEEDQLLIDYMTEMWTNFVKYGNPTPVTTSLVPVIWEPITPSSPHYYLEIDSELRMSTSPNNKRVAFWNLFLQMNGHLQLSNVYNQI